MASRLKLQEELEDILGSRNVYFQPPESIKLRYPCIIYKRENADIKYAEDKTYNYTYCYSVTVIDKNPDGRLPDKIIMHFPMISYNRHFTYDNLNHDVFTLYY